jgi:hypothetical protein
MSGEEKMYLLSSLVYFCLYFLLFYFLPFLRFSSFIPAKSRHVSRPRIGRYSHRRAVQWELERTGWKVRRLSQQQFQHNLKIVFVKKKTTFFKPIVGSLHTVLRPRTARGLLLHGRVTAVSYSSFGVRSMIPGTGPHNFFSHWRQWVTWKDINRHLAVAFFFQPVYWLRYTTLIYRIFSDAISTAGYVVLNEATGCGVNGKEWWGKWSWPTSRHYTSIPM